MAVIKPFRAWRYSKAQEPELDKLLTPPYDVISPEMQDAYYEMHDKNLVRIDYGKVEEGDDETRNKYSRAAELFGLWKGEGTLHRDERPAIYVYSQEFELPGHGRRVRRGFFCAVKLEALEEGIRAHERTFEGPKADRLNLTRATNANLSPIFCIYDDPEQKADKALEEWIVTHKPVETTIDGIVHRVWAMDDAEAIGRVEAALGDKPLYIADGHHRYETALNYRKEQREKTGRTGGDEPFDYTLMFLANTHDPGLEILPTHRVLTKELTKERRVEDVIGELKKTMDVREVKMEGLASDAAASLVSELEEAGRKAPSFVAIAHPDRAWVISLREGSDPAALIPDPDVLPEVKRLDVSLLHLYVINRVWVGEGGAEPGHDDIEYVKDATRTVEMVQTGEAEVAFLLNPTKMEQVIEIAGLGVRMPQKSTYFYPKIVTGMVIREMDRD